MAPDLPADRFAHIQRWKTRLGETGWWHSFELPNGELIEGASSLDAQRRRLAQFPIPEDLRGKRVLDVGTWDGWFAMEMERRGAEVVAIDRFENPRFLAIHEALRSRVEYHQLSVYELTPKHFGRFDIVLFLGVLYHLKHPLFALERVCAVARDYVAVESFVLQERHRPGCGVEQHPLAEFYERDEFGGQFDNWVAPTVPALLAWCRTAGFVRVKLLNQQEYGAAVSCYRIWEGPAHEGPSADPGLRVKAAFHADNGGLNFQSGSPDDYVACLLEAEGPRPALESLRPEVSGLASAPVHLAESGSGLQVNFKLPPGLDAGWHAVRLRTDAGVTNEVEIAVDLPLVSSGLEIRSAADGVDWKPGQVSLANGFGTLWVSGLPRNADRANVKVCLSGRRQATTFVGESDLQGLTQVNWQLSPATETGPQQVQVSFGRVTSGAFPLEVVGASVA